MLRSLTENGVVPVPEVWHSSPKLLVMSHVESDGHVCASVEEHAADLLAGLHNLAAPSYGYEYETLVGELPQPNGSMSSWVRVFAERRLLHMLTLARDASRLPSELFGRIERLAEPMEEHWLPEVNSPGLIHGDVWGGNVLARGGRIAAFIDPVIDRELPLPSALFAAGFDLLADGRVRLKLYTVSQKSSLEGDIGRALAPLPAKAVLELRRAWLFEPATLDRDPKLYAHFGDLPAEKLIAAHPGGRVGPFLSWSEAALQGMVIAFVSADEDKVELYFERAEHLSPVRASSSAAAHADLAMEQSQGSRRSCERAFRATLEDQSVLRDVRTMPGAVRCRARSTSAS